MAIKLTWLGHAAFLLETDEIKILLDPYRAPDVGSYAPIDLEADIVLASHLNPKYHSHWEAARGHPICLNALEFAERPDGITVKGITFHSVRVWESSARDVPVAMPYFTVEGLRFCHMGDLGHRLSADEAAPIRNCDVLIAVAGGPPTLTLSDLRDAIDLIAPRLVIPMHYGTGKINLPLAPIDDLIALMPPISVQYSEESTVILTCETLLEQTRLLVMPPAL